MKKLYVYSNDGKHVATVIGGDGSSDDAMISAAEGAGYRWDEYNNTYTPAFGFDSGLIENPNAKVIYLDN